MGYAVLHIQKGKGSGAGLGNHIDREPEKEHSYTSADASKKNLNHDFMVNKYCKLDIEDAINERIRDGYTSNRKIRTDAVKYCTAILTGSHDDMKRMEKDPKELDKWVKANLEFAKDQWGAENIVRFSLHRDEKTPHLHCVFVPITNDGRLSARELMGNKKELQMIQDHYAISMKPFNLKRGLRGSKAKHETVQEYYGRADRAVIAENQNVTRYNKHVEKAISKPSKLDILNLDKYHEKNLKAVKKAVFEIVKDNTKQLNELENENRDLKKEVGKLRGHLSKMAHNFKEINHVDFELSIGKDQVAYKSEGEIVVIDNEKINKALGDRKYYRDITKLLESIPKEIINAEYQRTKENIDFTQASPADIYTLAKNTMKNILKHNDTSFRRANKKNVSVAYQLRKTDNKLTIDLSFDDLKGKKQTVSSSNLFIENVLRNLHLSFLEEQKKQVKKKGLNPRKRGPRL